MAFTPHYLSNYNFSNGFCEFPPASGGDGVGLAMWCEENLPLFDNLMNGVGNYMVPSESDMTSSSISTMPLPQDYDSAQATWNMQAAHVPEMSIGFAVGNQPEGCEFGEECSGFASNFWAEQYSSATTNSWEIKGEQAVQESEEPAMKIGRYSVEERKDRISRYLKKRNQRNFNKTIKYACRKTLADKRVRVRGRFAKNNEASSDQDETVMKNKRNLHQDSFNANFFQIKHDDDEWLEAVASFMYLPYING
ncbi:CCT domain-containing protein [Heracleum sosnowskyi]|uniref:CCT domain-containing protein n=1 Tax=Heracleum sosnowskyi TaxID=360622 RepID=A0AAD8IPV2_9APIA|nr:CCT domain-containing protein [Heracleum sosnowskyi]